MSWKDRLQNIKFSIKTGDGKVYEPLWKNGEKTKEFNVSSFEFIDLDGSYVDRKKPKSGKYPLVFWFQGDDNIEQSESFEKSADDSRFWTVTHPFYGEITGQPLSLKRSDLNYNVTEISVDFWESILQDFPSSSVSSKDKAKEKFESINLQAASIFVENSKPKTEDISKVKNLINLSSGEFKPDKDNFNIYSNAVKTAIKSSDKLVTDTRTAYLNAQRVLSIPALFESSIKQRVFSYVKLYKDIKKTIETVFDKNYFEGQASTIISSIALASMNPLEDDYVTRSDIEFVNNQLTNTYEDYLTTIDNQQVGVYDVKNSWAPSPYIQNSLFGLVSFTSSSLFKLSFDARQERLYEVESDTNLILLTHRFLGLDANDENLKLFKEINKINLEEVFLIKKGREIKYFVS